MTEIKSLKNITSRISLEKLRDHLVLPKDIDKIILIMDSYIDMSIINITYIDYIMESDLYAEKVLLFYNIINIDDINFIDISFNNNIDKKITILRYLLDCIVEIQKFIKYNKSDKYNIKTYEIIIDLIDIESKFKFIKILEKVLFEYFYKVNSRVITLNINPEYNIDVYFEFNFSKTEYKPSKYYNLKNSSGLKNDKYVYEIYKRYIWNINVELNHSIYKSINKSIKEIELVKLIINIVYKINYFIVHNKIPNKITISEFVHLSEEESEKIKYIIYNFYSEIIRSKYRISDKIKIYFKNSVLRIKKVKKVNKVNKVSWRYLSRNPYIRLIQPKPNINNKKLYSRKLLQSNIL